MARTKAVLGAGARLSDFLSASVLARVCPATMIGEILDEHGCNSKRIRRLPAVPGAYFCMALSLYPEAAYEHVFAVVTQGLSWMQGHDSAVTIAKSSISEMRSKMGYAPLQSLVARACRPLADAKHHPDAFYAGLRLVAIDGSNLEVADEPDNVSAFGYPGSRTGHAGYPQAQCAVLIECASHAIIAANLGAYRDAEWTICKPLLNRLMTTLLDEKMAPALELAALYHERWEVEAVFDELKVHLLQKRRVLRSKTADLVRQEFYGWVLAHYAVRWLIHQAAAVHHVPDRSLSFTANVQLMRRAQPPSGTFSPSAATKTSALV